jgi:hypothetical protein
MAETLGSLCDKLSIVKLKQYHSDDADKLASLGQQELQLREEIDTFVADAIAGAIPAERLTFRANKVYKREGNPVADVTGTIGAVFARLADVNCRLWHEQEKVYDFARVPAEEKDAVVKQLAALNLEHTRYIDTIDEDVRHLVTERP